MGTALSITALPVLARIMVDLQITRTCMGAITISAAAVDDATGWMLLAIVTAIVNAQARLFGVLLMVAEAVGFVLALTFVIRPLLHSWIGQTIRRGNGDLGLNTVAATLVLIFSCAMISSAIGLCAIFGAFVLGAVLSKENEFRKAISIRFRDFVTAGLLPIFFVHTGLRTNIHSLGTLEMALICCGVIVAAVVGKIGGCGFAAWYCRFSVREASCIGVMMNTRGLMELVVINVGKDLGVVPDNVYCMLVLMALFTTLMTTPVLLYLMKGTELESSLERSRASGTSVREYADLTHVEATG
jgi:Kef-type K+ transport system membrane component KefB